jgi:DNA polymerase I-like protein with 3'-5' exonuclease and polymerase domains
MMPVARAWRRTAFEDAVNRGYVETPFGRKRRFPLINEETLEEIKKVAWNFPPQSIASDLTLLSTIKLVEMNVRVVLTVHDSIGAYVRDEDVERIGALMRSIMIATAEQWVPSVPWEVDVEVQDRWALRTDDDLALIGEVV